MKKSKSDGVYFFWSAAMLLCVVLAVFVLIFSSCAFNGEKESPNPEESPSPSMEATDPSAPVGGGDPANSEAPESTAPVTNPNPTGSGAELAETEDMGQEYIDKFAFLGDSTTYGLDFYDIIPEERVWTPANGTLTLAYWSTVTIVDEESGTEMTIVELAAKQKPEYLMITLGVNGVSFMDETYFTDEYTKLVNAVKEASPDTKIIINSIYPTSSSYDTSSGIDNTKITAANGWLRKIAEATGVRFINCASVIADASGWLPSSLSNDNALHLNPDGFAKVLNYIRTHGYV